MVGKADFCGVEGHFFEVMEGEVENFSCDGELLGHLGVAHKSVVGVEKNPEAGF